MREISNVNGEVCIGTDNYDFKIRKDENMKKELLDTIDEAIENICKWANKEFKPKEVSHREMMLHHIDGNDEQTDDRFENKLKIIAALSELLQARASIEKYGKEVTNE